MICAGHTPAATEMHAFLLQELTARLLDELQQEQASSRVP